MLGKIFIWKVTINVNLPQSLCFVVLLPENGEFRRFWRFCFRRLPERYIERQGRKTLSGMLQRRGDFHPEIRIAPLPNPAPVKSRCFAFLSYHSIENPFKTRSASRRRKPRYRHSKFKFTVTNFCVQVKNCHADCSILIGCGKCCG